MKTFLPVFLMSVVAAFGQPQSELFQEAMRAYQAKEFDTARMLFEAVVSAEPKNQAAQNYLRLLAKSETGASGLEGTLEKITLPRLEMSGVSAREGMTYVLQQVVKQSGGNLKANLVWLVPEGKAGPVTLSMQNIPANEAMRYIAEMAGLSLAYDAYAIKVTPAQ